MKPASLSSVLCQFENLFPSMKMKDRIWFAESLAALIALGIVLTTSSTTFGAFRVNTYTTRDQMNPAVVMDAQGYSVIVWESAWQDGSHGGAYGQQLDARGRPIGTEFRVNTTTSGIQKTPAVAMAADGRFTVVWAASDGSEDGIWGRQYESNGIPITGEFLVNEIKDGRQLYPCIAMNDSGEFVVSWERLVNPELHWYVAARQFNSNGTPRGSEFTLTQFPSGRALSVAINNAGDFVAAWRRDGRSDEPPLGRSIRTRRYRPDGVPKDDEQEITSHDLAGYWVFVFNDCHRRCRQLHRLLVGLWAQRSALSEI
jgi:hypothetical protein